MFSPASGMTKPPQHTNYRIRQYCFRVPLCSSRNPCEANLKNCRFPQQWITLTCEPIIATGTFEPNIIVTCEIISHTAVHFRPIVFDDENSWPEPIQIKSPKYRKLVSFNVNRNKINFTNRGSFEDIGQWQSWHKNTVENAAFLVDAFQMGICDFR